MDQLRYSHLEVIRKFLVIDEGLKLTMLARGLPPVASGVVLFTCPVRKELKPFQVSRVGKTATNISIIFHVS